MPVPFPRRICGSVQGSPQLDPSQGFSGLGNAYRTYVPDRFVILCPRGILTHHRDIACKLSVTQLIYEQSAPRTLRERPKSDGATGRANH